MSCKQYLLKDASAILAPPRIPDAGSGHLSVAVVVVALTIRPAHWVQDGRAHCRALEEKDLEREVKNQGLHSLVHPLS